MSDFRRPPEWQQQADRHTTLIDPVITVRQLSRFDFSRKSLMIDYALVFTSPKGAYDTFLPPLRPSRSEVAAKRYTAVYEVDMGVHDLQAELALPSDNDAFEFGATVDLTWQVRDPSRWVAGGYRDVPALLVGELQRAARPVTRRFPIADSARAEEELLQAVAAAGPLGTTAGLQVDCTLRLRRDQEDIEHQRRIRAIDHSSAEQIRATERGMEYDSALDQRARQQDALQLERAMQYGRQQQDLILQQQQWTHDQAMLQGRQQLELLKLQGEKIAFYEWHLQQGGVRAWAMHLAQHPEDSQLVMNNMREDQLRLIQSQMDLVGQLLSGDSAENYELEGPKKLALRTVSDILNQRLPGVPQTPPQLLPDQGLPQPAEAAPGAISWSPGPPIAPTPAPPPSPAQYTVQGQNAVPAAPATPGFLPGWQPPAGYGSVPSPPPVPGASVPPNPLYPPTAPDSTDAGAPAQPTPPTPPTHKHHPDGQEPSL